MSGYAVKRDSGLFIGDVDNSPASGTIDITENGTDIDVARYAKANVNVPQGGITVNESYDISDGTLNKGNITLEGDIIANIPDGVTTIGAGAFTNNQNITSVIIPDGVTTIEDGKTWQDTERGAFLDCTGLTSITIPDSVTNIDAQAFYGCTGLTSITIPNSVTSIAEETFTNCSSLTDIYYTGTQAEWKQIIIGRDAIPESATIHYEYMPN